MSYNGKLTPLELNVQSALLQNSGLNISQSALSYQGFWTPETYNQGSLTSNTALYYLTQSLSNLYSMAASGNIPVSTYRNAITIGRPINQPADNRINCPALGNSRPDDFKTSYAGFGTWKNATVDQYYNITGPGPLTLINLVYPPEEYPVSGQYSYVYNNWGSTTPGPYNYNYQWDHPYSWITGWPGKSSWQATNDSYSAAYFPRPDLRSRDADLIEYDEYFKNGFIGTVARQAYYEFWYNYNTRRLNQYAEFSTAFQQCYQWYNQTNYSISSFVNTKTFIRGIYSNINDLTTSDIAGVSLSFKLFGNDMIALGKSVDLSTINQFGIPSLFLKNLLAHNALLDSVKFALLLSDLTTTDIDNILMSGYIPTVAQENKIYSALKLITGNDLQNVLIVLNCTTNGLESLADLLNPRKMFPISYASLTIPRYTLDASSSKIYDFIYIESGVNSRIPNWGQYLVGILPQDLQISCGAFMMTMSQIKNIRLMSFEKLSQVVSNLEVVDKGLPLINTNSGTPGSISLANEATSLLALGSGNSGTYRLCDFYGSMSGLPYVDYYQISSGLLNELATDNLRNVYEKLYQKSLNNEWMLISEGKGWPDPIINPSPTWAAEYAYTLFTTQRDCAAGNNSIVAQQNLTAICTSGIKLAFESAPTIEYTITGSSYSNQLTTINFVPNLPADLPAGAKIYIKLSDSLAEDVQDLIDAANLEILRITLSNPPATIKLNYYWNKIGNQLFIEQRAIPYAISENNLVYEDSSKISIKTFITNIDSWAQETDYCGAAPILERISDISTVGGQSLVATMRESRNTVRLLNTSGELDNSVDDVLNPATASAEVCEVNQQGGIENITVTFGGQGYDISNPPKVRIGPYGGSYGGSGSGATATAVIENNMIADIIVTNNGAGYSVNDGCLLVYIDPPQSPARLGDTTVPGSFAGSPYTGQDPISNNLVTNEEASYTVDQSIEQVIICNCDCWNN